MKSCKLNVAGRKKNRKQPSQQRADYSQLEPRQLLATFVVNNLGDTIDPFNPETFTGTLRSALSLASQNNEPDTITFAPSLANGTITLTQTQNYLPAAPEMPLVGTGLIINRDTITIDGANASGLAISGSNQYRIFGITGTGNLTLRNITLEDGYVRGGDGGRGNMFAGSGGGGLGAGGAIFVSEGGTLTLVRATIKDSQAFGGNAGTPDTSYSVSGKQEWGAGGGGMQGTGSDSKTNNDSGLFGGGPNQRILTESSIKNSYNPDQFQGLIGAGAAGGPTGNALSGGGVVTWAIGFAVSETFTHYDIPDPTAIGGVISLGGDSDFYTVNVLTPVSGQIQYGGGGNGGFGGGGGGVGYDWKDLGIRGGNGGFGGGGGGGGDENAGGLGGFAGGDFGGGGAGLGGAIFINGGTVTVSNSTLYGNHAQGGLGADNGKGYGGGIFNRNGALTIINSTLAENTVSDAGTAVYVVQDGDLLGNGNGSGSSKAYASAMIFNSILWSTNSGHTDFEQISYALGDGMNGGAGNLIGSQNNFFGGIVSTSNPGLSPLGFNGGPTETCTFSSSSPAWQTANVAAAMQAGLKGDQRGNTRFTNAGLLDIGAVQNSTTAPAGATITSLLADRGNQNPSDKSTPLTFYASVVTRDGNRTPVTTGSVTFSYNGAVIGSAPLNSSGVATLTTSQLDGVYGTAGILTASFGSGSSISSSQLQVYINGRTVTTTADSGPGSLRQAIADSFNDLGPDYIGFAPGLAGQTINLQAATQTAFDLGPVAISVLKDTVTIDGTAAPGLILSGQNQTRLFVVQYQGELTLKNLTVSGGMAKGGDGGEGLNHGAGGGGGLGAGGAIFVTNGTLNVNGCTFTQNNTYGGNGGGHNGSGTAAQSGAGGGVWGNGDNGSTNWAGIGQAANGGGPNGAISDTTGYGQPTNAGYGGGGAGDPAEDTGTLAKYGNWGGGGGGQTGNDNVDGGPGGFGGGGAGRGRDSSGNPGGSYFGGGAGGIAAGNQDGGGGGGGGAAMGGAIFLNYGSVNITNSTFTANSAKGGVNGGNGAKDGYGLGGAIFNLNGTLSINSSTFSGNSAYDGRQIYVLGDQGSGMIGGYGNQIGQASVALSNSIFGGADTNSTDVYVKAINGGTTTSSGGSNLIRWNVGFTGGVTSTADPLLLPLTNNGGPTNTMQPTNSLAPISGETLYLTNKQNWLNNAVWYQVDPAENYATEGFTVSFVYQDVGGGGADGVAFVLQNDPRGFSALGSNGGGLGYQGIASSMAYAINVYAPGTVGSGLFTGGKIGTYQSTGNVNFASGNQIQVTLRYSAAVANQAGTFYETLRDLKTGASFSRTYTNFNLYSALGNNFNAVLGFTGGTGAANADQRISNLDYQGSRGWSISGFEFTEWSKSTSNSPVVFAGDPSRAAGLTVDQRGSARFVNGKIDIGAFQTTNTFLPPPSSIGALAAIGPQLPSTSVRQVSTIYQLILGRRPSSQELNTATSELSSGASLEMLALKLVQSTENRTKQINAYFLKHLQRMPTSAESTGLVNQLLAGVSLVSVRTQILKSPEYLGKHTDSTDLVQSLHVETLDRAANGKERKNLGKLSAGKVIDKLLASNEYRRYMVENIYLAYGLREPTKRELNTSFSQIKNKRLTEDQLAARLAAQLGTRS